MKLLPLFACSTSLLVASICNAGQTTSVDAISRSFKSHGEHAEILVTAHRADWRVGPENSLAAVRSAISKHIPIIEIDLQRTADGELVLMHDTTVNRTTNSTGAIASKTLAELRTLKLRKGLGGSQAPLTDEVIPTLAEVLAVTRGKIMVQLDKAWAYRDQAYEMISQAGMIDQVIFKSDASPAEVNTFMARDSRIIYQHIIDDGRTGDFDQFTRMPAAFEINYDRLTDAQIQPAFIDRVRAKARIFANTMWRGLSAGYTDEASLIDPAEGWETVIDRHHASVIQTDNPVMLMEWLGNCRPDSRPSSRCDIPRRTDFNRVIIQGEDYVTDGKDVGYHDTDDSNNGGSVYRAYEGVDMCNQEGAIVMCYIRGGEWVKYRFTVLQSGSYKVSARTSSPYSPAGLFSVEFDGDGNQVTASALTTTSHTAFEIQTLQDSWYFRRGEHELMFRVDPNAYQNFNVDYFELELN